MKIARRLLAGAAVIAGLAAFAPAAHAAGSSTFYIIRFSDHGDGGSAGNYWATDQGQAYLTVTRTGAGTYTASLSNLEGSFVTRPGQLAPNQSADPGLTVTSSSKLGSSAALGGSASYSFTASRAPLGSAVITITGDQPRMGTWEALAFPPGTVIGGAGITSYSLSYLLKCGKLAAPQTWTETSANNDGNLPADGNIHGC